MAGAIDFTECRVVLGKAYNGANGKRFFDFCSIKNTILESDSNGTGTELEDILDTIEKQQYVSPEALEKHFWDVFAAFQNLSVSDLRH